ncbi:XkdX family protein [Lactobacillus sp. PV037]|nr:XkdX family protein [Lactobacillus sp. PV037]
MYYDMGLYTKATIASFVQMGCVGPDAYKRITGDDYAKSTSAN